MNWMIVQQIQNGVLSKISYRVVGKKPWLQVHDFKNKIFDKIM